MTPRLVGPAGDGVDACSTEVLADGDDDAELRAAGVELNVVLGRLGAGEAEDLLVEPDRPVELGGLDGGVAKPGVKAL